MRVYIVEYRHFDKQTNSWVSKISQEGYTTLEAAQDYIETRPGHMVQVSAMYYKTEGMGEYYIHDILIAEQREAVTPPPPRPYHQFFTFAGNDSNLVSNCYRFRFFYYQSLYHGGFSHDRT